jgi:GNAT superfamily N-acetyltransferase
MSPAKSTADTEHDEVLNDGTHVTVRAIHPDDIELERRFIEGLSPKSRRFRFLESMQTPSAALLKQMTVINPPTDAAFVALLGAGAQATEIGVGRFSAQADGQDCEFAVTVSDAWQNKGLGTLLMQRLIDVAKSRGIKVMHSRDAADNTRMRQFADHLHFEHRRDPDDSTLVLYSVDLTAKDSNADADVDAASDAGAGSPAP